MKANDASSGSGGSGGSGSDLKEYQNADKERSGGEPGRPVPLRTTLETRRSDAVVEVYVTAVPVKGASGALRYVLFSATF